MIESSRMRALMALLSKRNSTVPSVGKKVVRPYPYSSRRDRRFKFPSSEALRWGRSAAFKTASGEPA
jgi:hypothetical protein